MLGRILCAFDLREDEAADLLAYAAALAEALSGSVRAIHVYDLPGHIHPDPGSRAAKSYEERALREPRKKLDALLDAHPSVPVAGDLLPGVVHRRIAEEVERHGIDLVVMGTHARRGVARVVLGSVAERVVRTSRVPVITVPSQREDLSLPPRSILVPYDFSAVSRRTLELARSLHKPLRASVAVAHVVPTEEEGGVTPWASPEQRAREMESARHELAREVSEVFGPEDQVVRVRVEEGAISGRVLELADELDTDLIAIGASGKNAVERALLGSTTVKLLRQSPLPVLTVP